MATLSEIAAARIARGENPDGLVHTLCDGEDLSSSITREDYQRGGYISSYSTLAEVAAGCWD